ncbi:MAG: PrpF domain-containing protein [Clostridium sp.]
MRDVGMQGTGLPEELIIIQAVSELLEKIRGVACCKMGFAKDLKDATENSPAVPKVGFVTVPKSYTDIAGKQVDADDMDVCVPELFLYLKCHKASPLTACRCD